MASDKLSLIIFNKKEDREWCWCREDAGVKEIGGQLDLVNNSDLQSLGGLQNLESLDGFQLKQVGDMTCGDVSATVADNDHLPLCWPGTHGVFGYPPCTPCKAGFHNEDVKQCRAACCVRVPALGHSSRAVARHLSHHFDVTVS